jgi:hypothetical protein
VPARSDPNTTTLIVQALVAIGGLGGFASVINAAFSRRRNRAEAGGMEASAAQVLTSAAASLVKPLEDRINAMEREMQTLRVREAESERREKESERRERELTLKLGEFQAWCEVAVRTLSEHGIEIAPPPDYKPFPAQRPRA